MALNKLPQKLTPASLAEYFSHEAQPVIGNGLVPYKEDRREYVSVSEQRKHKLSKEGDLLPLDLNLTDSLTEIDTFNDGEEFLAMSGDDDCGSLDFDLLFDDNPFTNYTH